ncbi:MAG TPA: hypothetical protein PL196_00105 [Burkholderiaceae bacterium]|nr:hypothetical protein [Burkholderiaceae bacterium]
MSSAAAWANTATATLWAAQGFDGWKQRGSFAAPVTFACDYKSEARTRRNAAGDEFISRHTIYTERSGIKPGDYVLIGASSATDPTTVAGAERVEFVGRFADTFERVADDYEVLT